MTRIRLFISVVLYAFGSVASWAPSMSTFISTRLSTLGRLSTSTIPLDVRTCKLEKRARSSPALPVASFISARAPSSALFSSPLSNEEISRYSRHLVLASVGMAGQQALKDAAVLVIGAGGLGSPCLLYLAAAGVGHIGIVDADVVDESNLQRQIIHGTSTVGLSKCESARQRLLDLNPHVRIRIYEEEFTSESAMRIVQVGFHEKKPYQVVVDGSDNFPTKYLINDVCHLCNIPWVYSAILAFEGQLSVFNFEAGPDYRDLLPVPPPPGDVPSCAEGGVLGVLPGTMGCLQATEVVKLLLGHTGGLLSSRVLVLDAMSMKFTEIGLSRSSDREPITALIDYQGFCNGPKQKTKAEEAATLPLVVNSSVGSGRKLDEAEVEPEEASIEFNSITPQTCFEKLRSGWSPWVLDVRLPTEHAIVALPFTDRVVPHRDVHVKDLPTKGDVLVYCKGGVRGKKACVNLVQQGVDPSRLYNLQGGILKWQAEIDPTMPRY